jgi:hypothetical protein
MAAAVWGLDERQWQGSALPLALTLVGECDWVVPGERVSDRSNTAMDDVTETVHARPQRQQHSRTRISTAERT